MSANEPILFTPGPVRIPPLVAQYVARPPCNYHRQDTFKEMFASTERDLKKLIGIRDSSVYFATQLTATGTGANEACLLALAPLGRGLLLENGFFAARAVDQARQNELDVTVLSSPADRPIDPATVATALDADPSIKWVFYVSHETRAGLKNPFEDIGKLCKARGLMVGADAISSAYAYPIDIEASGADLVTASSAKAIMSVPGIGIVFMKHASVPLLASTKRHGYYMDLVAEYGKQKTEQQTRFAQPVVLHAALRAACTHLERVGVEAHMARIQRQMKVLLDYLAGMGITPLLDEPHRSNIAVNFRLPPPLRYSEFSRRLEELGFYCLYGIPGDQSHFQLSTIGDLTDDHIEDLKIAIAKVVDR